MSDREADLQKCVPAAGIGSRPIVVRVTVHAEVPNGQVRSARSGGVS